MPILNINRYTCPITGAVEYGHELPPGWFVIMGEVFGPDASTPLAQYILDHPGAGFTELINSLSQPTG
jgi:hypothetical protein